ncbi:hypothetical protein V8C44DRAFT_349556 [Trichoderma aethiopicum]
MACATVEQLSPAAQDLALQTIDKELRQSSTKEYLDSVKSCMLFRPDFNWSEQLSAAPLSVSILASLFVASTVPDATHITIIPPTGGFKYLENFGGNSALNACLIQCADTGAKAFATSSVCFDAISQSSANVKKTVNQIIRLLGDARSAQTLLAPTMQNLSRIAHRCEDRAREMESAFERWLDMVSELHMCVVQTSSNGSEKRRANQIQLAVAQTQLASNEERKRLATDTVSTLNNTLETATSAYKQAADEFPSGWDRIAQQVVSGVSESITGALTLAIPALIEIMSQPAAVAKALNIFTGGNGGAVGGPVGSGEADHSQVQAATDAPPSIPKATIAYPNDPAYSVVKSILPFVSAVHAFVTSGKDQGVDWKALQSKEHGENGLKFLKTFLEKVQKSFKPSSDPPSEELRLVFDKVKTVTEGLGKVLADSTALNGGLPPAADSKEVKEWTLSMAEAYAAVVRLDADAKNLAGAGSPPLVNPVQFSKDVHKRGDAFRKQVIDAATIKLETTASVMKTVTEKYDEASKRLVDIQSEIGNIQAELSGLTTANMDLDNIKRILVKCIELLVPLKSHISRLVGFFGAVKTVIDNVVNEKVDNFLDTLKSVTGANDEASILNFSLTDLERQMIFGCSLSIRAYFDLFQDISDMYLNIYNTFIRQGLEMVNEMQIEYNCTTNAEAAQMILNQRSQRISAFNESSVNGVRYIIQKRQNEILGNLQNKATEAANSLASIPAKPSPVAIKAIESSSNASMEAAKQGIHNSSPNLARPLSDTNSLIDESEDP